jgi:GDPmannose 4,6-dehydratase
MTQIDTPEDFIIATGQLSTIGEFAENAFATAGFNHEDYVRVDHQFDRAGDVATVQADISKAKSLLDWQPTVTAQELARIMTKHDLQEAGWQE